MNKEEFIRRKQELVEVVYKELLKENLKNEDREDLQQLLDILNKYTFEDRLRFKGLMGHTIVDSIQLDYAVTDKFMKFDQAIN